MTLNAVGGPCQFNPEQIVGEPCNLCSSSGIGCVAPAVCVPPELPADTDPDLVYGAVAVLYKARHDLPNDILRSLADIWVCGSAARFGEPYERFWETNVEEFSTHDTARCEVDLDCDASDAELLSALAAKAGAERRT